MGKRYLIGFDIGTTTMKAAFLDAEECKVVTTQTAEIFPIKAIAPDWIEYDASEWWTCIKNILKKGWEAGVDPQQVAGICFGGWTVMAFLVDENGEPLNNPVHYNDMRHMVEVDELQTAVGALCLERNGNHIGMYSGIAKQYWWKKHMPQIYEKARHFCTEVSWINWKLTGVWGWNRTEAGFYGQYNTKTRQWDEEIIAKLGFRRDMFPKLFDAWEIVGHVTEAAAAETGLAPGTPVLGGVDDASPVAITTGAIKDGQCFLSVGSGANVVVNTTGIISHPTTITYPHCIPGLNMLIAVLSSTGLSYKWMRNALAQAEMAMAQVTGEDPYTYMNQAAAASPAGANGVIFLPYLDGDYTPNNDANARGCFIGIGTRTTKNDLLRAVLEGVGFSILSSIMLIRQLGGKLDEILLTGGIAKSKLWLQIISDITDCSISLPEESEGAPFGSAIVAGLGTGVFSSYDDAIAKMVRINRDVVVPNRANSELYRDMYTVYQGLYSQLADTYAKLADIRQKSY